MTNYTYEQKDDSKNLELKLSNDRFIVTVNYQLGCFSLNDEKQFITHDFSVFTTDLEELISRPYDSSENPFNLAEQLLEHAERGLLDDIE